MKPAEIAAGFPSCKFADRFRPSVPDRFCIEPTIGGVHGIAVRAERCLECVHAGSEGKAPRKDLRSCAHNTGPIDAVPCACPAIRTITIFGCDRHDDCVLNRDLYKRLPDDRQNAVCETCKDFSAREQQATSEEASQPPTS